MPTCAGCDSDLLWVVTEGGRRMPLDPVMVPDGNVVLVHVGGRVRARVLGGDQLPVEGGAYTSHHRTCPKGDRFRGAATPINTYRCLVCRGPMNRKVTRLEMTTTHPCCDPGPKAAAARHQALKGPGKGSAGAGQASLDLKDETRW